MSAEDAVREYRECKQISDEDIRSYPVTFHALVTEAADAAIEALEADLAALKARRCKTCSLAKHCWTLAAWKSGQADMEIPTTDFSCYEWTAMEDR